MKKMSKNRIRWLSTILFGAFSVGTLAFDLLAMSRSEPGDNMLRLFLFLMFLCMCLSRIVVSVYARVAEAKNKIAFFKNIGIAAAYLVAGVLSLLITNPVPLAITTLSIYLVSIIGNRICMMFERRKLSSYIINGILVLIAGFVLFIIVSTTENEAASVIAGMLMAVLFLSLIEVLTFAFSRIQLRGLLKIMRKTYVPEIMYGLVILILSCSFYFTMMEDSIPSFGDALWYSFAIVTTIGFGDFTAHGLLGRILSVVLGIYGVIVVATITSVIVNFYNETKSKETEQPGIDQTERLEQALENRIDKIKGSEDEDTPKLSKDD